MNTIELVWKFESIVGPCTSIINHFGLPGGKYITSFTDKAMLFHFDNPKDALMCKLLVSEYQ